MLNCLLRLNDTPTYYPHTMSRDFYYKLYNSVATDPCFWFTQGIFNVFFESLQLPKLSPANRSALNAPITAEELAGFIQHLPSQISPGPDGLPYSYYKAFLLTYLHTC